MPVHIGVVALTLGRHRDVHYRCSTWSVGSKGKLQVHQVFWQLAQEGILQSYQVFLEGKTRHLVSGGEGEGQELRRKGGRIEQDNGTRRDQWVQKAGEQKGRKIEEKEKQIHFWLHCKL